MYIYNLEKSGKKCNTNSNIADGNGVKDWFRERFCATIFHTVMNHVICNSIPVYKRELCEIWSNRKELRLSRIFPTYGHSYYINVTEISS